MPFLIVPPNISHSRRRETKQYTNMYLSSKPAMNEDNRMMPLQGTITLDKSVTRRGHFHVDMYRLAKGDAVYES
jgi:hypothetical protein